MYMDSWPSVFWQKCCSIFFFLSMEVGGVMYFWNKNSINCNCNQLFSYQWCLCPILICWENKDFLRKNIYTSNTAPIFVFMQSEKRSIFKNLSVLDVIRELLSSYRIMTQNFYEVCDPSQCQWHMLCKVFGNTLICYRNEVQVYTVMRGKTTLTALDVICIILL